MFTCLEFPILLLVPSLFMKGPLLDPLFETDTLMGIPSISASFNKILNYDKIIYCQIHQLLFWHRRNVHIQHLQFPWSFPNCPNGFHIFSKDPLERKYSVEKKIFKFLFSLNI